ncbi:MAG: BTAD domain-containing putative transcriptional regulator [Nocardioides sp.]|uniref:AfsR/SARP family transcriptional regulator n=1 Tax=Nocardioides sp. TaxID=35761 RepID=UPI003D69FF69
MLGPIAVRRDDSWERVRTPKLQGMLSRLVVSAGMPVSIDSLIEELWPDAAPETATNQVHGYVSRLRKLLSDGALVGTRSAGYELLLGPADTDAMVFETLATDGRIALEAGRADHAAASLRQALDLWEGPALGNPLRGPARIEADRLDELRSVIREAWADAEIRRGRAAADLVAELRAMVDMEPLREHRWELLLRALHESGRTAEALASYRRVYRLLGQELGVSPGGALTALHARILEESSETVVVPQPRPAPIGTVAVIPRQLPAPVSDFTGRVGELTAVTDWILAARHERSEPSALLLSGWGGIGKTALAVQAAHEVADRFPDGQIHLDLRGFSPSRPLPPRQALIHCLHSLGTPADQVPKDEDEAIGLYRTALAGRRVLLVLDNAADADQLAPLIPPTGSLALVTSRHTMSGLVASGHVRRHPITPMTDTDARELLTRLVGPQRSGQDPDPIETLADVCAGLPLAIRIAAANLADDNLGSVGDQVRALSVEAPLDFLRTDDADDDHPETSLAAAFSLSYRRLSPSAARAFCLTGLTGTDEFTLLRAASLLALPEAETRRVLASLCDCGLLERSGRDRYRTHHLLRSYARECVTSS